MATFAEKLLLEPPSHRLLQGKSATTCFRFHNPDYLHPADEFWKNWIDDDRKWQQRGRYSGVGLNPGSYFAWSREAAESEARFYNRNEPLKDDKAEITLEIGYRNILNLTEQDAMEFIFSELLEFRYRRKTVWLALLASLKKQGSSLTDYIGGWAYHKGYAGVLFLSARALEPHRQNFDSSTLAEGWGQYWSQMADEFDYFVLDSIETYVRPNFRMYINVVYFDGLNLIQEIEKFTIRYPGGKKVSAKNPYRGKPAAELSAELGFTPMLTAQADSLQKMEQLQKEMNRLCVDVKNLCDWHSSRKIYNQEFGEMLEYRLLEL